MNRRAALLSLGALAAGCGGRADLISFDRGEFALTYAKLLTFGQNLLTAAIAKNTKAGTPNAHALQLKAFSDQLVELDAKVTKAILEAPQKAKDSQDVALGEIAGTLTKALPYILPLLGAAAL